MSHIPLSLTGQTPFEKLIGHSPNLLNHWNQTETAFFNSDTFDADLITSQDIDCLKKCFTENEISELVLFCSFISASQRFGAVLGLQAASNY